MAHEPHQLSATEPPDPRPGDPVSPEEVHQQLDRILKSPAFQRSERLPRFLRFVCEYTLRGEGGRLHEYLIGSEVFDRGAEYSPHEDGIVRRQAHTLRRKLQEYYERDGANDPVRIELPVGRYVPVFRRVEEPVPEVVVEAIPKPEQKPDVPLPQPSLPKRWVAIAAAAAVVIFASGWLAALWTRPGPVMPAATALPSEVREIWEPWLSNPDGAVVCFSNPLTAIVKHYQSTLAPDSQPRRMPLTPEQDQFFRSVVRLPAGGHIYFAPAISQTKMGEAFAAVRLTTLFTSAGRPFRATQSRFVSWEDLTRENVILLGHNEANRWVDRVLKPYPFQLSITQSDKQRAIINTRPNPGEKPGYQIQYADEDLTGTDEYALISMLPGVDAQHLLLLINGLNTQATQSAAEYLTTPSRLKELVGELRKKDPQHSGPWYFQAVLRTEVHDKVPTNGVLVALRLIGR